MKLPNFIIGGFPKCGSTTLFHYLDKHPQIFLPKQKELHYFNYKLIRENANGPGDMEVLKSYVSDFENYKKWFYSVKNEIAIGDSSSSFLHCPEVIPMLLQTFGNELRIICILRDPVERAYSNYLHLRREGRETLSFEAALKAEDQRKKDGYADFWYYTTNSKYSGFLDEYSNIFKNFFICTTEELQNDTMEIMGKMYRFLGVDESLAASLSSYRYNSGGVFEDNVLTNFLFRQSKWKTRIKKHIPMPILVHHLKGLILKRFQKPTPKILIETKKQLTQLFGEDVERLKSDYGVNTDSWSSYGNNTRRQ